jgi:hypothetical protein
LLLLLLWLFFFFFFSLQRRRLMTIHTLSKSTTTTITKECANFPTSSIPFKSFKHVHAINLSTIQQPISLRICNWAKNVSTI